MEVQSHHEKLFVLLAVLVGVSVVTNMALTERANKLERSVAMLEAQLYVEPSQEQLAMPIANEVRIETMAPVSGRVGEAVVITGSGFLRAGNEVHFGEHVITVDSQDGMTLKFFVPGGKILAKTHLITVVAGGQTSNAVEFTVKP